MFHLFQSYIVASVFMYIASVLSGCYICLIYMLQVYVSDVYVAFKYFILLGESRGHSPVLGAGRGSQCDG
jgi:hypothetical protein